MPPEQPVPTPPEKPPLPEAGGEDANRPMQDAQEDKLRLHQEIARLHAAIGDMRAIQQPEAEDSVELLGFEERYRLLFEAIDVGFCTIEVLFDAQGVPTDYRFL